MVCQLGVFPRIPPLLRPSRPVHSGLAVEFALFLSPDGPVHLAPVTCSGLHPTPVSSLRLPAAFWEGLQFWKLIRILADCVGIEFLMNIICFQNLEGIALVSSDIHWYSSYFSPWHIFILFILSSRVLRIFLTLDFWNLVEMSIVVYFYSSDSC